MTDTPTDIARIAEGREQERAAIVAWLREDVGAEAIRMMLIAGMPGGTRTERVKRQAFADGVSHATSAIREAIEVRAHLLASRDRGHQ